MSKFKAFDIIALKRKQWRKYGAPPGAEALVRGMCMDAEESPFCNIVWINRKKHGCHKQKNGNYLPSEFEFIRKAIPSERILTNVHGCSMLTLLQFFKR